MAVSSTHRPCSGLLTSALAGTSPGRRQHYLSPVLLEFLKLSLLPLADTGRTNSPVTLITSKSSPCPLKLLLCSAMPEDRPLSAIKGCWVVSSSNSFHSGWALFVLSIGAMWHLYVPLDALKRLAAFSLTRGGLRGFQRNARQHKCSSNSKHEQQTPACFNYCYPLEPLEQSA